MAELAEQRAPKAVVLHCFVEGEQIGAGLVGEQPQQLLLSLGLVLIISEGLLFYKSALLDSLRVVHLFLRETGFDILGAVHSGF